MRLANIPNMTTSPLSTKISILIGTRDRAEVLICCLQSILTQNYTSIEVLVLDDNSGKYRLDKLLPAKFQDARLRCFRSEQSLGVAGGRNFLMKQATGDIFCIIDDDAVFGDDNCVSQLVAAIQHHPNVGIIATKVIDHRPDKNDLLVPFSIRWRKKQPALVDTQQRVSYYLGTCHAIRREVVEQCGPYRHDLVFGEEELDLSYRTIEAGFEILYLPDVIVHHHPEPSVVDKQGEHEHPELFHHVRNRFFLAYKYLPWQYIPVYLFLWLLTYGRDAIKLGAFKEYFGGLLAGLKIRRTVNRTPLTSRSVQYLKNHFGRLWY